MLRKINLKENIFDDESKNRLKEHLINGISNNQFEYAGLFINNLGLVFSLTLKKYLATDFKMEASTFVSVLQIGEKHVEQIELGYCYFKKNDGQISIQHIKSFVERQKIGSTILNAIELWAKNQGCGTIKLDSLPQSITFWEKHGYSKTGEYDNRIKPMSKDLLSKAMEQKSAEQSISANEAIDDNKKYVLKTNLEINKAFKQQALNKPEK